MSFCYITLYNRYICYITRYLCYITLRYITWHISSCHPVCDIIIVEIIYHLLNYPDLLRPYTRRLEASLTKYQREEDNEPS